MIFADYKPNVTKVPYILIETEKPSKKLSLTSSHLIFTSNSTATKFKAKQAGSVVPGEIVLVSNGSKLVSSLVRRVSLVERTGMIAPVTIEGNLIVDEVLSSCYAKIMDHDVAHMAFAPLRLAYTYAFNAWSTEGFIQQGMHWYPQILIEINRALSLYKLSWISKPLSELIRRDYILFRVFANCLNSGQLKNNEVFLRRVLSNRGEFSKRVGFVFWRKFLVDLWLFICLHNKVISCRVL